MDLFSIANKLDLNVWEKKDSPAAQADIEEKGKIQRIMYDLRVGIRFGVKMDKILNGHTVEAKDGALFQRGTEIIIMPGPYNEICPFLEEASRFLSTGQANAISYKGRSLV